MPGRLQHRPRLHLRAHPSRHAGRHAREPAFERVANLLVGFLFTAMSVNLSLAFFNLIPLPPLDGSSILVLFLKGRALQTYYEVQRYAMPILIVVLSTCCPACSTSTCSIGISVLPSTRCSWACCASRSARSALH